LLLWRRIAAVLVSAFLFHAHMVSCRV
jgi:hypothetical protein